MLVRVWCLLYLNSRYNKHQLKLQTQLSVNKMLAPELTTEVCICPYLSCFHVAVNIISSTCVRNEIKIHSSRVVFAAAGHRGYDTMRGEYSIYVIMHGVTFAYASSKKLVQSIISRCISSHVDDYSASFIEGLKLRKQRKSKASTFISLARPLLQGKKGLVNSIHTV